MSNASIEFFKKLPISEFGNYIQGIPNENYEGAIILLPTNEGLEISTVNILNLTFERSLLNLKKHEIIDFSVEDQTTIESKVTISRMLLVGLFALAWRARKSNPMAFILIKYKDDLGLEQVVTLQSTKKGAYQTFNNIKYNIYKIWKESENNTLFIDIKKDIILTKKKENGDIGLGCIFIIIVIFILFILTTIGK